MAAVWQINDGGEKVPTEISVFEITVGVNATPKRFMNAAICSRLTVSVGQNSVGVAQPSVIERFFSHSTFGQKPLAESTSVKPAQGAALDELLASSVSPKPSIAITLRIFSPMSGGTRRAFFERIRRARTSDSPCA